MSTVLTLDASTLLYQSADNSVTLHFEGVPYASDQLVPYHIAGGNSRQERQTASAFVARWMTKKHGADRQKWPRLAQEFCLSE